MVISIKYRSSNYTQRKNKHELEEGNITKEKAEELRGNRYKLDLKLDKKLEPAIKRTRIMKGVEQGELSEGMKKCGQIGFKIGEVKYSDYETILDWSEEIIIEVKEKHIRKFIVDNKIKEILGDEYKEFELYEDEEGRTGELYNTGKVGEIDLLYWDPITDDFLVVELKKTEDTSDKVVDQISRYMGWVKEHLAEEGETKGLIISRESSVNLDHALKANKDIEYTKFRFRF